MFVLGEQICRTYDWRWLELNFAGVAGGVNVVEPQGRAYVNPTGLIKDIVDDSRRANNTALLFNMLGPEVLSSKAGELAPGRYLGLC